MPPKKKGGSKTKSKGKKKKEIDPEEKLRQDLLEKALSLQQEIEQEHAREEQFQTQTGQLKGYWDIEKKVRDEKKQLLLEKEHRLQGIADKHTIELGQYKQIIKQLLFANQDELSEKTTQSFMEYQSLSDEHHNEVGQLYNELHDISNRIKETTMSYDTFKLSMRQGCNDDATILRDEARRKVATLASYSEQQYKHTRETSEKRLMDETKALEERNESTIQQVMEKNKNEIQQMRLDYSTTMNENLDTITRLRKEVVLLREQDRHDRRVLSDLQNRNNDILGPLETNRTDLTRLESDLDIFHKQKEDLDIQKQKLRRAEEELKGIEWDHEVLFQKLQALEVDRDIWKKRAQQSIHSAQQHANFQNLLRKSLFLFCFVAAVIMMKKPYTCSNLLLSKVERKLGKLSLAGQKNTAAMAEILRKANVDLDTLKDQSSQICITDVIEEKNNQVGLLEQKLKRIKEAHATMIDRYKTLMEEEAD